MDYEKAYKEALKRAKAAIDIAADKDLVKGVARTIFPELRESEDERIINQLITLVNSTGGVVIIPTNKEELIAWLEKQKEQKPVNHNLTTFHRDVVYCAMCNKNLDEGLRYNLEIVYNVLKDIVAQTPIVCEQKEQKLVECELEDAFKNYTDAGITVSCGDIVAKPKEQKPAEWSEDDERKLNRIYEILGYAADDKGFLTSKRIIGDKEAIELQDFFKSLRPSWKPSEEQMMALHYASYGGELSPDELLLLDSLYNQLSELM